MTVRTRMKELLTLEDVEAFLKQHPTCAIFKAGSCHKTMQGFGHVEEALNPRVNIHLAYVKVIPSRPVSNYIEQLTGIKHESPQLILFVDGKPVYDVDNWDITPDALSAALTQYLGPVAKSDEPSQHRSDVSAYVQLLRQFLNNQITEEELSHQWVKTFKADATPRSKQEFNLINSICAKPKVKPENTLLQVGQGQAFREKAKELLEQLLAS